MGIFFRLVVISFFLAALYEIDFPLIMSAAMILVFALLMLMRVLRMWAVGATFILVFWAIAINLGEAPAYSSLASTGGVKTISEKIKAVSHDFSLSPGSAIAKTGTVDEQIQALNLLLVCGVIQKEEAGRIRRSIVERYVDRTDQSSAIPGTAEATPNKSKPE